MRIGFVGLGVMGSPMAGHLIKNGHSVAVWNRTKSKSEPLQNLGAEVAPDLSRLAQTCSIIFLCVSKTEDVEECISQMIPHASPNTLFIDHSTIAPQGAIRMSSQLKESGMRFMDCPITGGSMGAEAGTLTIFCGGESSDFAQAKPFMDCYGKTVAYVGKIGQGQVTKLANQIAVGGALAGLCESLAFAKKAGLDLELTKELLSKGAAGSWAFDNYGPKILNQDWTPGFSVENQRKDFGYCFEYARALGMEISVTTEVDRGLSKLTQSGRNQDTTAALFDTYEMKEREHE